MKFEYTRTFKKRFKRLSKQDQARVTEKFELIDEDSTRSSLRLQPMKGHEKRGIWEGHISMRIVFTFTWQDEEGDSERTMVLRKIGGHDIYDDP